MTLDRFARSRRLRWPLAALAAFAGSAGATAHAQLDPLLFLKRVPPNVIVVLDTSFRMLDDGRGTYYDPHTYAATGGDEVANELGVPSNARYRRRYVNLRFDASDTGTGRYQADAIEVAAEGSSAFDNFWALTRFEIAREGIRRAVAGNSVVNSAGRPVNPGVATTPRWSLVKLPQSSPVWAAACDSIVSLPAGSPLADNDDRARCAATNNDNEFGIFAPSWSSAPDALYDNTRANHTVTTIAYEVSPIAAAAPATAVYAGVDHAGQVYDRMTLAMESADSRALKPAGADTPDYQDRPLTLALERARRLALALTSVSGDPSCRNTIVVLVTGGKNDGPSSYLSDSANDAANKAQDFLNVNGRRVPIYVVGVKPPEDDESELRSIAAESAGRYLRAESASEVARAINLAVQTGFSDVSDFALSRATEYLPVSPIVGTVNLVNARYADGTSLPDDDIETSGGIPIPQRSNVLLVAGFALGGADAGGLTERAADVGPGFDGRLRAFRAFRPVADTSRSNGYRFEQDGTALWPDEEGRGLAGQARVPADPAQRNIFTYVPGVGLVAFNVANLGAFGAHLNVGTAAAQQALVEFVRRQPLGGVVGSTPALMDPPSIDPPPDADYGRPDGGDSYAGRHTNRRSIIWFGGNDGMIHGVDARTGFEVWAFIPYNLLPKLRALYDGQPVEQFDYFVDSSPKIAEVKVGGEWRSVLVIGQGPGGTFYQAFDVTEAGMGGPVPESDDWSGVLASFASPSRVPFLWSFPEYASFDTSYTGSFPVTDGTPGGRATFYGDIRIGASSAEKSVGFTWSDPAVGPLNPDRSTAVVITGSGYFPPVEDSLPGRGVGSPRAGRSLYLLDIGAGKPLGNPNGPCGPNPGSSGFRPSAGASTQGCFDVGDDATRTRKNSVQADPTAAGVPNGYVVQEAYLGDLDGRFYRFGLTTTGTITATWSYDTAQPIYASSALMVVGSTEQYVFFSTGSDLLPHATPPAPGNGGTGPFKLVGLQDLTSSASLKFSHDLSWPGGSGRNATTVMERPSTSPSVAGDIVFFTTTSEDTAAACSVPLGNLYAFTYLGSAAYATTSGGTVKKGDTPRVATVEGRATAPFIVDQHLYFATSGGGEANVQVFGDPNDYNNGVGQVGVRILSWREMRR